MSVHYKFKSSLDFDTITFDGLHISVNDFRKAVIQQKRLGKTNDFELQITNAQTKEEYENDSDLIPKNTSLIISRIPQTSKKSRDTQNQNAPSLCHIPKFDNNNLDLSQMNASEEDKIQAMMAQSTVDYDPRGYQKIRCPGQTGEVPPTYRCYKCHQTGHWIKNCPLPHSSSKKSEIRRNTGIPKSFLQEKGIEKESVTEEIVILDKQAEVPDELVCSICKDIFRDAVMIPCCGSSFCDDCVRTALLESEENECPDCKEKGTSPGSLIPNRFLRSSVNTFKNETGYERKRKNNGTQEAVPMIENTTEPVVENITKVESPEKSISIDNKTTSNIDMEQTPPKQSPEKDNDFGHKGEDHILKDAKVKTDVKEEYPSKDIVESGSPKRHVEVVLPQREVIHNSEVQVRPDEGFKQGNQTTFPNYGTTVSELPHRSGNVDSYSVRSDTFMRHSKPGQGLPPPHMNYCNNYGNRSERYYYPREPFNINTAPYPYLQNNRCRQMAPHSNIQPYYQGMSGSIEPGIIEDPLEAFNRIMKEKEKRKELKRMTSDRHRSSAVKRSTRDGSPITEKRVRHRASPINERRNRSPLRQEKPVRSSERDKNLRVHRSHYSSNKRSFSRSNSPPQRRYSKSPRRRSRSRSHPRSHSREYDIVRHDGRSSKHCLQQSHKGDHEKDFTRFTKKTSGRFSETRNISDIIPKENRRHNSKLRENGNIFFDNYSKSSRKMCVENENLQENRDTLYEFDEKRAKAPACKSDDGNKGHRKGHENDGNREKQHSYPESELPKQESERKTKERKKKKDKDEKSEKKSKKEKKDKKKRERNKEDIKKHSQLNKSRKESLSNLNQKVIGETANLICTSRIVDAFKSSNEESLDDRTETFTPDINISRNMEIDKKESQDLYENRLDDGISAFKGEKSPKCQQNADNNCSGLNTPTSFVDTTPENYAGKWDNFDFSVPNSEEIKEDERNCEYDRHMFQNFSTNMRDEQNESIKHLSKKKEPSCRSQLHDEGRSKNGRSESNARVTSRRPSPVPSEAMSSSTNNSNAGKSSQSKRRRKKSKHKKEKQYYKRSSSADSSRHSRKSSSKHKKSRSDKKKKAKRNESR